ncbi:hypothetical protein AGLY_016684 [Aphis glycines]|uniref:Hcy-binding domain-containing protein n=1 Tax=Aphis glycines TaxID=307491 RepID=A0A6G0SXV4_APHGL|nr:hypothetical protein AGLY_016684 [Aphis glycines]
MKMLLFVAIKTTLGVTGADFLTTVTYQVSIGGFQKYLNLDYDQSYELIKKSVMVCRQAITEENKHQVGSIKQNIQIMGSVGPYGASLDTMNLKELYDWHKPRIQALVKARVDITLFETIPSIIEATVLLNILTEFPNQKAYNIIICNNDGNCLSHGENFSSVVEMFWSNDYRKHYDDTQIYKVSIDDLKKWNNK